MDNHRVLLSSCTPFVTQGHWATMSHSTFLNWWQNPKPHQNWSTKQQGLNCVPCWDAVSPCSSCSLPKRHFCDKLTWLGDCYGDLPLVGRRSWGVVVTPMVGLWPYAPGPWGVGLATSAYHQLALKNSSEQDGQIPKSIVMSQFNMQKWVALIFINFLQLMMWVIFINFPVFSYYLHIFFIRVYIIFH